MKKTDYFYTVSSLYGAVHALIDCTCAISIFGGIRSGLSISGFAYWVVMYNFIAFVLQPIIGVYVDKHKRYRLFAVTGCVLVIIGACITFTGWISIIIFAFGNALFHVAAGAICLTFHKGKTVFAGIFVAPGDIGLAIGTLIGQKLAISPTIILCLSFLILGFVIVIHVVEKRSKAFIESEYAPETSSYKDMNYRFAGLAMLLLCIVITVRAFIGSAVGFSWVEGALLAIVLSFFISAGKAAGGFFADKIGQKLTGVAALLLSAPLIAFLHNNVAISLVGIFIFNMTMPLTMTAIFDKLPEYPAFSFGIAAMALIPGFYLGSVTHMNRFALLAIVILTAIVLYFALSLSKRGLKDEKD